MVNIKGTLLELSLSANLLLAWLSVVAVTVAHPKVELALDPESNNIRAAIVASISWLVLDHDEPPPLGLNNHGTSLLSIRIENHRQFFKSLPPEHSHPPSTMKCWSPLLSVRNISPDGVGKEVQSIMLFPSSNCLFKYRSVHLPTKGIFRTEPPGTEADHA